MTKPINPSDVSIKAKAFDLLQTVKFEKYGIKVMDGKPVPVDEHLKPKLRS